MLLALVLLVCLVGAGWLALFLEPVDEAALSGQPQGGYSITISEICAKNETVIADNGGKFRDYIELYNTGDTLNLKGFCLTDGKKRSQPFGDLILGAGERRVVFLGNEITGFALSASGGDCVQLLDPWDHIVVQANTAAMLADQVMLLTENGYTVSDTPSPGFANDARGVAAFRKGFAASDAKLVLSEMLIANVSALPDEKGIFTDVVELCNVSDEPLSLGGYCLSDSLEQRFRYRLPEYTLQPGDYLVIFCDGENYIGENGEIHANFGLSVGETLCLTDPQGGYLTMDAQYLGDDVSFALPEEGEAGSAAVSLGYPNTAQGAFLFAQSRTDTASHLVISEVLLSSAGIPYKGSMCDAVEILNQSADPVSTAGWYLSDGGDPYSYPLPEKTLAPGERMVILCGPATTGFSLTEGETLWLTAPTFRHAPAVTCVLGLQGQSQSLQQGGEDLSYGLADVSMGYSNDAEGCEQFRKESLPKGLVISEVMSYNKSYVKGPYATTCDWVELYNSSDEAVELSEYYLSDEANDLYRYALPQKTLGAGEYCVILLSQDDKNLAKGYPVLPFGLSSDGDCLYLSHGAEVNDYVFLPALSVDTAYGRPAGSLTFTLLAKVTPGKQNSGEAQVSSMPVAVTPQGCYDGVEYVDVELSGDGPIYYTTNCKEPGSSAKLYTGPIRITKTTVFRVVCREKGKKESKVLDLTYLVNENDTLPVVTIVTHPDNLWSSGKGIYIMGPGASDTSPYYGANFWKDWERKVTLSLFETDGTGFSQVCGIKIFGGFTRERPKKSLAVYFRSSYGDGDLDYPLFGEDGLDTYEAFVLRAGGQDAFEGRMRDVLNTSLISEKTDVAVQRYRPVVVYLNGEYFGLHYIREKINEHYIAGNYNVDPEEVTIGENNGNWVKDYRALRQYAKDHDLNVQEHYDYVCARMDVQEYMDYQIAQIWNGNLDNSNVKYFKTSEGVWRWILYDTDLSMWNVSYNSVYENLNPRGTSWGDKLGTELINGLLKRPDCRDAFLRRFAWQLDNVFSEENVIARINEIEAMIKDDMVKDCKRWGTDYSRWQNHVERLRTFARERNGYLVAYVQDYFDLTDQQMVEYGFHLPTKEG